MEVNKVVLPPDIWPKRADWRGKVVEIYVTKGDRVSRGDPLIDVEIEKAILSLESEIEGVVERIHVKVGDEVSPGEVLMEIREV